MTARLALAALAACTLATSARAQAQRPDVIDYDFTIDLPDSGHTIAGRAVLTVVRRGADTLRLDLIALRVDSALVAGRSAPFTRGDSTVAILLPPGAPDTVAVTLRYEGAPGDGLIIRTDSLGRWTAFGDNWPRRARYWLPVIDWPDDKATVTWTVRAPSALRVVANGELLEETPLERAPGAAARTLTRWRESRPIAPYLMVIAAAPLAYFDLGRSACGRSDFGGCVRQSVYVLPEAVSFLPGPFAHAADIVSFYAALIAPFPYERLAHLQSLTRFGGMENATAIFYADALFRNRTLGPDIIAHETAHQWFGDAVTERRFADLWLSEGFATYWALLWERHARGDSAFRAGMERIRGQIVTSDVAAERPVRDTAQTDYLALLDVNSYQKGAWVLHMLRATLGDSAFFRGVRAYYLAHRNGNATSDDLRAALERSSGRQLGWFFDQWLTRPGWIELATSWRYDPRARRVSLEITQGTRFAPYRFPLTVEVRDAAGRVRRATVAVAASRTQRIALPLRLDAPPRSLTVDPDVTLLATFETH